MGGYINITVLYENSVKQHKIVFAMLTCKVNGIVYCSLSAHKGKKARLLITQKQTLSSFSLIMLISLGSDLSQIA